MTAETIETTTGPADQAGPVQTILAAALDAVRAQAERERREARERAVRDADQAAKSAASFVQQRFGDITAQLHDHQAWTGYPPLAGEDSPAFGDLSATAVAWLGPGTGGGVWLHFTDTSRFYTASGLLTVVTACPCGRFRERGVDGIRDLAAALSAALTPAAECDGRTCTPHQSEKDAAREDD